MHEKNRQYYNLKNNKTLIERRLPTERDLEKFEEWRISKREQLKRSSIGMIITFLIIVVVRNWFR